MIFLTLPYPPLLNRYYRVFRGRNVLSADGKAFKENVTAAWYQAGCPFLSDVALLEMSVIVYRPQNRGDIDGYLKSLLDSLNGLAYRDDNQIAKLTIEKRVDKKNKRCEIAIWEFKP